MGTDRVGSLGDCAGRVVRRKRGLSPRMRALIEAYSPPRYHDSLWNLLTLADAVLTAPTDRGTVNVWLARDLARTAKALWPA